MEKKDCKQAQMKCPYGKVYGKDWDYRKCKGCRYWLQCGVKNQRLENNVVESIRRL